MKPLLMVCSLVVADPNASWRLNPKYAVGLELVYRGSLIERTLGSTQAQFEQPFELEANMLVMDLDPRQTAEVGCYTVVRLPRRDEKPAERNALANALSVRFDVVKVTASGTATWAQNGAQVRLPPEGHPGWEFGYLAEVPKDPVQPDSKWIIKKPAQPHVYCQVKGIDVILGVPCVCVEMIQTADNWETRDVDQPAWRHETKVWIDPDTGAVVRVWRSSLSRRQGADTPTRQIVADYNLVTSLRYHGGALQERLSDFKVASQAQSEMETALSLDVGPKKAKLTAIKQQLAYALGQPFSTPYRAGMQRMLRLVEDAAERSAMVRGDGTLPPRRLDVGDKAKNFVIRNVETNETLSLRKLLGKPFVLVFVDPQSPLSQEALRLALACVRQAKMASVRVFAVCTEFHPEGTKAFRERHPGDYTICTGSGIDGAYGINGYPHLVFVDADGILRANDAGVGPETEPSLTSSLKRFGRPVENLSQKKATKGNTFLR